MTTTTDPAVIELLTDLAAVGVRLSPDGANLRFSAPGPLGPELRARITALKAPLLAYLSVWCGKRAQVLQQEADALVEQLGVEGTDAVIANAAEQYFRAWLRKDMAGVRAATHAIEDRARFLAASATPRGAP